MDRFTRLELVHSVYQHCKRMDYLNPRIRGFKDPAGVAMASLQGVSQIGGAEGSGLL